MTVDIFYKTYKADFNWLSHSLRSLSKHVTGYNEIHIIIPEAEKNLFHSTILNFPERTIFHYVKEYGTGYLFQQWCKISGHKYCRADFILFSDSDLIFDHDINLQSFVEDGKPEILYTSYDKVGDAICWKEPTEAFIKDPQEYEFMRRNALIYHRSTLEAIEQYEPNLEYIIMNSERFSEYNAIGAYAWKFEKDKYNFVNTDNWEYVRPKAVQYHSYTEFNKMKSEFPDL
jgi:hypothetical protein